MHVVVEAVLIVGGTGDLHGHGDEAALVETAGMLCETSEELVALGGVGCLVGYGPYDNVRAILVAEYHVGELPLRVGIGVGIGPGDGPVAGNLAPHHDAHALGLAHGILVVGIVGQTHEVAS